MNVRVVDESGVGTFDMLPAAIRYAVDNGAHIVNMSIIGETNSEIKEALAYAYEHDVSVFAAIGNNMSDLDILPRYPVCADAYDDTMMVMGVSAIEQSRRLAVFSNVGTSCVDITAPGVELTSTVRFSPTHGLTEKYMGGWSGTSFATPLVSGTAALIKAIQPTWGPDQIYKAILKTTHRTPNDEPETYARLFGAGLLQVHNAVNYAIKRVISKRVPTSLLFVSPNGTQIEEQISTGMHPTQLADQLEGIDDVVSYRHEDGLVRYVTSRQESTLERRITTYSDAWQEMSSVLIPASGALNIAIADVTGDEVLDLVVSPQYADEQLLQIYSLDGVAQDQYSISGIHTGVSHAITQDGSVVTFSEFNGERIVHIFDHTFDAPASTKVIQSLQKRGSIALGDVDGDREDEIILGGARGERPVISIYEMSGALKRTFTVYGGYQGGFSLASLDYDANGKDDILVVPTHNTEPARIWTGTSKKLVEWQLFAGASLTDITSLLRF